MVITTTKEVGRTLLLLSAAAVTLVTGHVSLTFPPARKYDLDFLDTFRTLSPCGMYSNPNASTLVEAGEPLTVTWHLGYPHRGGIRLEILDYKDKNLLTLTPANEYVGDKTDQEYTVNIPEDLECKQCSIRLTRQALEWGSKYRFQSCADIEIVPRKDYTNKCSRNGSPKSGGTCNCKPTYYGDQCQYKNDCDDDAGCNNHGQCLEHFGTALPKKSCYCEPGYFGLTCERESALKVKAVNMSAGYEEMRLNGDRFKFLWRFIGDGKRDEIEGVIVAKTTGFVAVGWRPEGLTKSCRKFPADAPAPIAKDFHAMDCQDMVIAKVKGDLSNVGDYYTRDRSTPRRDSFYGGSDDLTAAIGWEEDGVTTVIFRKPVVGSRDSGKADHDFTGLLKVIWANGQAGVDFYKDDELKYHGGNRGQNTLQLGSEPLSQQRIILIAAMSLLGFILLVQAIHKLVGSLPCCTKDNDEDLMLKHMK